MDLFIESLIIFFATFLFILLIYICFINRRRKNVKTEGSFTEPSYLINRFKLDTKKFSYKKIMWITTFLNAFIIAFTAAVVIVVDNLILQLVLGFGILLVLIFVLYEITGRILVKKGYAKNKKNEGSEE